MPISSTTRRALFDELQLSGLIWHGRLTETDFLNRIFDLRALPSLDHRFKRMEGDVWQHRINNDDWDEGWICTDSRLDLVGCEDGKFLQFLCEMIHPIVRSDPAEVETLVALINRHLNHDDLEIYAAETFLGDQYFQLGQ